MKLVFATNNQNKLSEIEGAGSIEDIAQKEHSRRSDSQDENALILHAITASSISLLRRPEGRARTAVVTKTMRKSEIHPRLMVPS